METSAAFLDLPPTTPSFERASGRDETAVALARAEARSEFGRYDEALRELDDVHVPTVSAPDLALRVLHCEAWARMYVGELDAAATLCERARALAEGHSFTDVDRAEALFRLAACRFKLGKVGNAVSLLGESLRLADHQGMRGDRVRARAFEWRARCYVIQRDWEAAQYDAEHAVELAGSLQDTRLTALAKMQCSVIAERRGDPRLARYYAECARDLAAECGDSLLEARLLNNLGGLSFLLDEPAVAVGQVTAAFTLFLELGNDTDAAQAVSSLAQIHLRCGAPQLAEEQARHALSILDGRADYVDERGNARLVLGRALLDQERVDEAMSEFSSAEWLFEQFGSSSHVAAAWVGQGDAYSLLGDLDAAAALYRRAASALQDFHF